MSTKWIVFLVSLWIILAALGGMIDQTFYDSGDESSLEIIMNPALLTNTDADGVTTSWSIFGATYRGALLKLATLDFKMFLNTPYGGMLHWMLFLPIGLAMLVTFALAIRGTGSGS